MDGLLVVTLGALYLALILFAMRWAWRRGRTGGGSRIKACAFALTAFLAIYLPVFWNHIPVVLAHRAMCANDAGFTANITPQEWIRANEFALAAVKGRDLDNTVGRPEQRPENFRAYRFFGGLLESQQRQTSSTYLGVSIIKYETHDINLKTGERISSSTDYYLGNRDDIRRWLHKPSCAREESRSPIHERNEFFIKIKQSIQ